MDRVREGGREGEREGGRGGRGTVSVLRAQSRVPWASVRAQPRRGATTHLFRPGSEPSRLPRRDRFPPCAAGCAGLLPLKLCEGRAARCVDAAICCMGFTPPRRRPRRQRVWRRRQPWRRRRAWRQRQPWRRRRQPWRRPSRRRGWRRRQPWRRRRHPFPE